MGGAVRRGSCDVDAVPPEVTPPTAPTSGREECGRSTAWEGLSTPANPPISFKKMAVAGLHREGGFSPVGVLTFEASNAYINSIRHAAAAVRRRVFEALH